MTDLIARHMILSGKVQGVGFRHFTRSRAQELGISGWVRNLDDGSVEVMATGPENSMLSFIEILSHGPVSAYVKKIEQKEVPVVTGQDSFSVRY